MESYLNLVLVITSTLFLHHPKPRLWTPRTIPTLSQTTMTKADQLHLTPQPSHHTTSGNLCPYLFSCPINISTQHHPQSTLRTVSIHLHNLQAPTNSSSTTPHICTIHYTGLTAQDTALDLIWWAQNLIIVCI